MNVIAMNSLVRLTLTLLGTVTGYDVIIMYVTLYVDRMWQVTTGILESQKNCDSVRECDAVWMTTGNLEIFPLGISYFLHDFSCLNSEMKWMLTVICRQKKQTNWNYRTFPFWAPPCWSELTWRKRNLEEFDVSSTYKNTFQVGISSWRGN